MFCVVEAYLVKWRGYIFGGVEGMFSEVDRIVYIWWSGGGMFSEVDRIVYIWWSGGGMFSEVEGVYLVEWRGACLMKWRGYIWCGGGGICRVQKGLCSEDLRSRGVELWICTYGISLPSA